jgi:hypothetical protein
VRLAGAVGLEAERRVERPAALAGLEGPEHDDVAALVAQLRAGGVDQRAADASTPAGWIDVERGDLADAGLVEPAGGDRQCDEAGDAVVVLRDQRVGVVERRRPAPRALGLVELGQDLLVDEPGVSRAPAGGLDTGDLGRVGDDGRPDEQLARRQT